MHGIELIGHQQHRGVGTQQRQHLGVGHAELPSLDHEQHQIHVADRSQHGFVQRAVQGVGVTGLKPRGVDKNELGIALGAHAGDAVTGGLGLARGDADLLTDQGIEQRGLAHIGAAHDGHQATTLGALGVEIGHVIHGCDFSMSANMAWAAACSPARREVPWPRADKPKSGTRQWTSKVC